MPKKFKENTKAAEAKARKNAVKDEQEFKKKQAIEDASWKEDDKHVLKKIQRKEDKDKKKTELQEKKKEVQKLAEDEMAKLAKTSAKCEPDKMTRSQIEGNKQVKVLKEVPSKKSVTPEEPIEENLNRVQCEGCVASNIDEAINILNGSKSAEVDKHPEKRMKAAYLAFEEKMLPLLKIEYPTLRHSQLRQTIRKDWIKSPDNPINQAMIASAND